MAFAVLLRVNAAAPAPDERGYSSPVCPALRPVRFKRSDPTPCKTNPNFRPKVYARVRPLAAHELRGGAAALAITIESDRSLVLSGPRADSDPKRYKFDHVFDESAQNKDVFAVAYAVSNSRVNPKSFPGC